MSEPRATADSQVQPATTRGFLFADLRDYTRYAEAHGDQAADELLAAYRALVRDVLDRFSGAEVRTEGDSFYVVFPSASSAIQGGLAILDAAAKASAAQPDRPIRAAIGVHAGETADSGQGPVGTVVNIAARVCAQARAGELLVTDTVRSLTRTHLSVRFSPRGPRRLKGIAEPIALYAVEAAGPTPLDELAGGRDRRRSRRTWIAPAAALVVLAAAGVLALASGLIPRSSAPSGLSSASPSAALAACSGASPGSASTLPPVADVLFYRVDAQRDSLYPGPGPVCQPVRAWEQPVGPGARAPIVVDGNIIVGDQENLHAFDARTGAPVWTVHGAGGFSESGAADNGVVFAADLGGTLHAVDVHAGAPRWTVALPESGIHPLVAQGLLWVGASDGHAYGLDLSTGQQRWKWTGPSSVQADVAIVTADTAYITAGGSIYAVRLVDQGPLWRFDVHCTGVTVPVLADVTIYVASRGAGQEALYALDKTTGKNRWGPPFSIASGNTTTAGPVKGGIIYVTTAGTASMRCRTRARATTSSGTTRMSPR